MEEIPSVFLENFGENLRLSLNAVKTEFILIGSKPMYVKAPITVQEQASTPQDKRAKPCCRTCGKPMKGHKNVLTCPRNQK